MKLSKQNARSQSLETQSAAGLGSRAGFSATSLCTRRTGREDSLNPKDQQWRWTAYSMGAQSMKQQHQLRIAQRSGTLWVGITQSSCPCRTRTLIRWDLSCDKRARQEPPC